MLASILLVLFAYNVRPLLATCVAASPPPDPPAKVIYTLTNDLQANEVVALPTGKDGLLSEGTRTWTGGKGSYFINVFPASPNISDALNSQNSLVREGDYLFAVNAGSNTLSMLAIKPRDPLQLTLIGKPVNTLGEFPVTIAASSLLRQVCVTNGGAIAGVACFDYSATGISPHGAVLRPFDLGQSTPPTGFPNTIGGSLFNGDTSALYVTAKAGLNATVHPGFFTIFPVDASTKRVSTKAHVSVPKDSVALYGATNLPGTTNIFQTDAAFGALIVSVSGAPAWKVSTIKQINIPNEEASCWAIYSIHTGTVFVTDGAKNHIYEIDPTTGELITSYYPPNKNDGMLDHWVAGQYVYALAPGNQSAITVFDISGGRGTIKQVQNFRPKGVGLTAQGMAAWTGWN